MAKTKLVKKSIGLCVTGKLGEPCHLGEIRPGWSGLGLDDPYAGIYQRRHYFGKSYFIRLNHYQPSGPPKPGEIVMRHKYYDAVGAWRALTDEDRAVYNERVKNKPLSGWNLFYKEYLLSH